MHRVIESKIKVIDYAFEKCGIKSFAELGCTWGVDCAYGLYAMKKYGIKNGIFVDKHWPDTAIEAVRGVEGAKILMGNLGDQSIVDEVGAVDAVIMFWVLLHQVKPDWDEVLRRYAKNAKIIIIANPQWLKSKTTIRLLDLGKEEYFKNVPHYSDHYHYKDLFERLDEPAPEYDDGRSLKDAHYIWQWGITNSDLIELMDNLGYEQIYASDDGQFENLINFHDFTYIFIKREINWR